MHRREDFPGSDTNQHYRLLSGGLDQTWAKPLSGNGIRAASTADNHNIHREAVI